jgi:HK97 family phage prohead protease
MSETERKLPDGAFTRAVDFELVPSDGQTLDGYAAVFDSPTRISSMWEGEFDEVIKRGAFTRSLAERTPILMFDHGYHPLIGDMPLGPITDIEEDERGLHVIARLSNNWLIEPVRDAIREGAVTGMSFRFQVPADGETWIRKKGETPLRILTDVTVPELGPVVFPAYEPTTVSVRSMLDRATKDFAGRSGIRDAEGGERERAPGNGHGLRYDHLLLMRGKRNA